MRLYSPANCLRRSASSSMHCSSNQFHGGVTQSMALRKCSWSKSSSSHSNSGLVNFSLNRNIRSSEPLNLKYFVSLVGRQFRCGLSTREGIAKAEMPADRKINCAETSASSTHGKKIYTDYSVTGIPGDGRCLFRSVVHGACVRSGKAIPNEDLQRKLADELRSMVADEFVTRREETEWFIEGDFDTYVSQIRQPHVWGGEPELFMASHVLQMPITVYMRDEDSGGLITIAEYGQEYGKEDPIKVLYHGFGHYDSLQIPANMGPKTKL
ncbi:hypothetical protein BRADI_3g39900v3 [Brachypodium distachyon]|uniref:Ubiquitin thioesterase OTU n=1 Tax=Brachypodium distachyon TaxID=15368 RepID=I1I8F4_BRADI|nr:hypothetical protein BRADI_3g39900v3 [Brachypodium distachyon]